MGRSTTLYESAAWRFHSIELGVVMWKWCHRVPKVWHCMAPSYCTSAVWPHQAVWWPYLGGVWCSVGRMRQTRGTIHWSEPGAGNCCKDWLESNMACFALNSPDKSGRNSEIYSYEKIIIRDTLYTMNNVKGFLINPCIKSNRNQAR